MLAKRLIPSCVSAMRKRELSMVCESLAARQSISREGVPTSCSLSFVGEAGCAVGQQKCRHVWLGVFLAFVLSFGPHVAWAATQRAQSQGTMDSGAAAQEASSQTVVEHESVLISEPELSDPFDAELLSANGPVLTSGTHRRFIDRVKLPQNALTFYDALIEASDNDGVNDYLIQDSSFVGTGAGTTVEDIMEPGNLMMREGKVGIAIGDLGISFNNAKPYVRAILGAFDRDHPEVFWLNGSISYGGVTVRNAASGERCYLYLILRAPTYDLRAEGYTNEASIRAGIVHRVSYVNNILGNVRHLKTQFEKLRFLNTWLTTHNEYNTVSSSGGTPQGILPWRCLSALAGRTGAQGPVCEGYARAFKVLCDELEIPCLISDGVGLSDSGSVGHMWNLVLVEGAWYGVDVTWNDPTGQGVSGALSGHESEKYFLVGLSTVVDDRAFDISHQLENQIYSDGLRFTNQPAMALSAYDPTTNPNLSSLEKAEVSGINAAYAYTGEPIEPLPVVRLNEKVLEAGQDYRISYAHNTKVGKATVTLSGLGSYVGTKQVSFDIKDPVDILMLSPQELTLKVGGAHGVATLSGYGVEDGAEFSVEVENPFVAQASLEGKLLQVEPLAEGTTMIVVNREARKEGSAASTEMRVKVEAVDDPSSSLELATSSLELVAGEDPASVQVIGENLHNLKVAVSDPLVASARLEGTTLSVVPLAAGRTQVVVERLAQAGMAGKKVTLEVVVKESPAPPTVPVYRLYNDYSGEHLFTLDEHERDELVKGGWKDEAIAWNAPTDSSMPVYRLYNPYSLEHLYTAKEEEKAELLQRGWEDEGIAWYSSEATSQPVYRLYNSYAPENASHHYTTDSHEYQELGDRGWSQEDAGWYGFSAE